MNAIINQFLDYATPLEGANHVLRRAIDLTALVAAARSPTVRGRRGLLSDRQTDLQADDAPVRRASEPRSGVSSSISFENARRYGQTPGTELVEWTCRSARSTTHRASRSRTAGVGIPCRCDQAHEAAVHPARRPRAARRTGRASDWRSSTASRSAIAPASNCSHAGRRRPRRPHRVREEGLTRSTRLVRRIWSTHLVDGVSGDAAARPPRPRCLRRGP